MRTLPLSVVAAKSWASVETPDDDNIEWVIAHASGYSPLTKSQFVRSNSFLEDLQFSGISQEIRELGTSVCVLHCSAWSSEQQALTKCHQFLLRPYWQMMRGEADSILMDFVRIVGPALCISLN